MTGAAIKCPTVAVGSVAAVAVVGSADGEFASVIVRW